MSLDGSTQIVINNNGTFTWQTISAFVDGLMSASPSSVLQPDVATKNLPLTSGTYSLFGTDIYGYVIYRSINAVTKVDTTKLTTVPKMLNIKTTDGRTVICTANTKIITRLNNTLTSQAADEYNVNDAVACGMASHILTGNAPYVVRQVQFQDYDNSPVPNIDTATWGTLTASRNDCINFLTVLENDDSLDQSDVAVFNEVLAENISYDTIGVKSDIETPTTLYDLVVDGNVYQTYNQIEFGTLSPRQ